jgi:hypothetical protein
MTDIRTIYGEWAFASEPTIPLTNADRMLGARISFDLKNRPEWVDIQFQTADGQGIQEIRMDFVNAMFLLSCLKSMQLDSGLPFPDDPRAPSARQG